MEDLRVDELRDVVHHVEVPDWEWPTLEMFAEWFVENRFPMKLPELDHQQMFSTDSSVSFIWFRYGRYQAEMYMFHPHQKVPRHSHPMEQIFIPLSGHMRTYSQVSGGTEGAWRPKHSGRLVSKKLPANYWHNLKTTERGCMMFVLQRYPDGMRPTSASVDYDGEVTGEIQRKQKIALGRASETPLPK